MPRTKKFPVPTPGALDQSNEFDVSLRVRLSGKPDVARAELQRFFERELPLHLPFVEVREIEGATA